MDARVPSQLSSRWKQLWRSMLTPARFSADDLMLLQARSYLLFLLLSSILLALLSLLRLISNQDFLSPLLFSGLALIIYGLARSGLIETSVFLSYVIVLIVPHLLPYILPYFYPTTSLAMLLLASAMVPLIHLSALNVLMRIAIIVSTAFFYFTIPGMTLMAVTTLTLVVALMNIIMQMSRVWVEEAAGRRTQQMMPHGPILEELPGLVTVVQEGELRYLNAAGAALLGAPEPAALMGLPPATWLGPLSDLPTTSRLRRIEDPMRRSISYFDRLQRLDGAVLEVYISEKVIEYQGHPATLLVAYPLDRQSDEAPLQALLKLTADFAYSAEWKDTAFQVRWLSQEAPARIAPHLEVGASPSLDAEMIHPDDRPLVQNHWRCLQMGQTHSIEYRVAFAAGRWRWVHEIASPMANQNPMRVYGVINDVMTRMQAEDAVKLHAVQQAVVAELGLMALSSPDFAALLKNTVILCAQALEVSVCDIMEYHPQEHLLRRVALNGTGVLADASYSALATASPASYALQTGVSLSCANLAQELRFTLPGDLQRAALLSCASVPIHGLSDAYGVLSVFSDRARQFSDNDLNFLQAIANVLASSHQQHRIQAEAEAQVEINEALRDITSMISHEMALPIVLHRILEHLAVVVPQHDASTILLYNEEKHSFDYASGRGYDSILHEIEQLSFSADKLDYSEMVQTRRPLIVADVQARPGWLKYDSTAWIRAYIGAPIFVGDRCIGIINLDSAIPDSFTQEDADRLMAFADKTAIAIQDARRADELEHLVQERTNELQRERAQIEAILEATGEGIFYLEDGSIRFVNAALLALTGFRASDLVGQPLSRLRPRDLDEAEAARFDRISVNMLDRQSWREEMRLVRQDSGSFEAELTISRVGRSDGDVPRLVVLVRDISARKMLEEQKTRFIANAAHELRTPIANLNTRIYLMRRDPKRGQEDFEALERIASRMNRLVSDLLDLSYFDHGRINLRREAVLLPGLLQEVVRIQQAEADQKSIQVQVLEDGEDPVYVLGDEQRLQQVFTNLIVNAIIYTPENGHIRVRTSRLPDQRVEIAVEDDGPGIAAEKIPYLFQPFYRVNTDQKGTGLGLAISHEIISLHEGELRVESEPGKGSRFIVSLQSMPT